jgi:hypothetical protein
MLHPFRIKNPQDMSNDFPCSNKAVVIDESLMHGTISEKSSTPPQFHLDRFYHLI